MGSWDMKLLDPHTDSPGFGTDLEKSQLFSFNLLKKKKVCAMTSPTTEEKYNDRTNCSSKCFISGGQPQP